MAEFLCSSPASILACRLGKVTDFYCSTMQNGQHKADRFILMTL